MQLNVLRSRQLRTHQWRIPARALATSAAAGLSISIALLAIPAANADSVIATLKVGTFPESVAITPDGTHAYVTNTSSQTVSVIDTATNAVTSTIPVGAANAVVITPDSTRAYVRNQGGGGVSVIDTATNTVTSTIPLPWSSSPATIAIAPNGAFLYATSGDSRGNISVIDTATNAVTGSMKVGQQPEGIAFAPDASRAYILDAWGGLDVIDTSANKIVASLPTVHGPTGVAVTPEGSRVYVADVTQGKVLVIDTATNTHTDTIELVSNTGQYAPSGSRVAITPDGTRAYVTSRAGAVHVIDTATNTTTPDAIPVGAEARGIAITPDGTRAYVTNYNDGTVSVISIEASQEPIDTGSAIFGS
ncbi:cytochrome D1 domain-containing protein [Rhodococcus triatomae]